MLHGKAPGDDGGWQPLVSGTRRATYMAGLLCPWLSPLDLNMPASGADPLSADPSRVPPQGGSPLHSSQLMWLLQTTVQLHPFIPSDFELLVPAVDISFSTEMGPPLAGWLVARLSWARVPWASLWGLHSRATGKDKAGPALAAVPLIKPRALQNRQGASGGLLALIGASRGGWSSSMHGTAELQGGGHPGARLLPWEPPGGKACRTLASSIFGISGLNSSLREKKPCRPRETRVILGTSWANMEILI